MNKMQKKIKKIFKKGHILYIEALKIIYLKNIKEKGVQIGISIPKKFIRKAVDRNLLKRRLKNSYIVNKHILNKTEINYLIFFIWVNNELPKFQKIEQLIKRSLFFLIQENR